METASLLKPHEPASVGGSLAFCRPPSALRELQRGRALLWRRLWLRERGGWLERLPDHEHCLHVTANRPSRFLITRVLTGVAVNFLQELACVFAAWLLGAGGLAFPRLGFPRAFLTELSHF